MNSDTPEYRYEHRIVRRPTDSHRSSSHKSRGAESDLLRQNGTNRLMGPTESYSIEEATRLGICPPHSAGPEGPAGRTLTTGQTVLAQVLSDVAVAVTVQFVLPAVERGVRRIAGRTRSAKACDAPRRGAEVAVPRPDESGVSQSRLSPAWQASPITMTNLEYQEQLRNLIRAEDFVLRCRAHLANVRIVDGVVPEELQQVFARLIENGACALDDVELAAVIRFFDKIHPEFSKPEAHGTPELPPA